MYNINNIAKRLYDFSNIIILYFVRCKLIVSNRHMYLSFYYIFISLDLHFTIRQIDL